jgi:hypothetical protein
MTCAVPVMEVGPPGSPSRRGAQTAAVSCRSRAGVGSDCGEGPLSAGQVCDEKANMREPLLTHRNVDRWHPNRGLWVSPGQRRARVRVLSRGASCVLPWWCPVYRWRELVVGAGMEQENLSSRNRRPTRSRANVARLVGREREDRERGNRERQSTARHRGGPARSSDESPVMGLEPRGRAGQVTQRTTLRGRN